MTYPSEPRIHGNGFIQVDLDELHRLHLWDVMIPRQSVDSSIHDHAFGFESRTLQGMLVPAGTPAAVVKRLHAEVVKILALPDTRDRIAALGFDVCRDDGIVPKGRLLRGERSGAR